jgi:hypothetical protein
MTARIFTILIGTWLFLSAFAWPHQSAQGFTALVCGALTVFFALLTIYLPNVRYMTAATAVVLFVASLASAARLDRSFWHNAVIAVAIFFAAVLDPGTAGARRERELYGRI